MYKTVAQNEIKTLNETEVTQGIIYVQTKTELGNHLLSLSVITSARAVPPPSMTTLFTLSSSNRTDKYVSTPSAVVPSINPDNNK